MGILLIGEDGKKIGDVTFDEAKRIAQMEKKDLILVNAENNVYKIADFGKLKYDQKQKIKNQRAQKRTHKIKEIKLRLTTEQHDIDIKVGRIQEFLRDGLKTKITIQLKGRQQAFQNVGLEKMKAIIDSIMKSGTAIIDKAPTIEGKNIIAFLIPIK